MFCFSDVDSIRWIRDTGTMVHGPYLLRSQEQHCAVLSQLAQSLDQGQLEEDLLWKADLEVEVVEAELVLPPPVAVDPAVVELPADSDGVEGLPVADPVAEAEALQRGRQDSRRQGQRGT